MQQTKASGTTTDRDRLVADDHRYLWHPFSQATEWVSYDPVVVERADGFYLVDVDGRRYLDGVSSIWCNVHGHGHPRIVNAMKEQLDRVSHSTMLGLTHVPAIELARGLVDITPRRLSRVFYSDSGSTSVEVALRMAFQYWRQSGQTQRTAFVTLAQAYHGDTMGAVSLGFSEPFHRGYQPITFEVSKFSPPWLCPPIEGRGSFDPQSLEEAAANSLAEARSLLERLGDTVAAVVIEPLVQGAAGIWPQPPSFLRSLRELCDDNGALLVCDEVATGFGRTGSMFAVEQAAIEPDIMCLAKGLGAGYLPLAATLASETIYQAFAGRYSDYRSLFHGHTFGGNPLGCAAALANLDLFSRERTVARAAEQGKLLGQLLAEYIAPLEHCGPPRNVGMMAAFDILSDAARYRPYPADERRSHRAVLAAREEGVIIRPLGDTMVLMPPLNMPSELLETVVRTTAHAVQRATAE